MNLKEVWTDKVSHRLADDTYRYGDDIAVPVHALGEILSELNSLNGIVTRIEDSAIQVGWEPDSEFTPLEYLMQNAYYSGWKDREKTMTMVAQ